MPRWRYVECWWSSYNVSIAWQWSIRTPFRKQAILKVVCLSSCVQTWQSMNSDFLQIGIIMLLFRHPFDPFIAIKLQHSVFILGSYRSSDAWLARYSQCNVTVCEYSSLPGDVMNPDTTAFGFLTYLGLPRQVLYKAATVVIFCTVDGRNSGKKSCWYLWRQAPSPLDLNRRQQAWRQIRITG